MKRTLSPQIGIVDITQVDTTPQHQLGTIVQLLDDTAGFQEFIYSKVVEGTVTNGTVLVYTDSYGFSASTDVSDASQNQVLGVSIGTVAVDSYAWFQRKGYHSAVKTDGGDDIADGDSLIVSSTDGTVDSVAAGTAPTYKLVGIAVAADVDAANTVAAQLCIA